ncbi:MAG TPA: succinate--CoA ligase subunit alpha [Candidatus Limnocylindrales bacterium]
MSILVGRDTRLLVQGITGREGAFHAGACQAYGTNVVAGMTPGKGGQTALDGSVPVFDTVAEAVRETGANTSLVFVPAAGAPDAVMEAAAAGIETIFCITEGIPALDMIPAVEMVRARGARLIGPNCPGATSPGARAKVGIIPGSIHREGRVGVVSRSGTLTYEAVQAMTDAGIGQSTCVGIGGDPIIGTTFLDVLELFAADDETDAVVLIGEIGGAAEETAAAWAAEHLRDIPKVAFIAGRTAPEGKRMGHAGAIISGGAGTAASKVEALEAAGFRVAGSPTELPALLRAAGYRGA